MLIIKCPKCHKEVKLDIEKSIDENGEVYVCEHCKWPFMYTEK